MSKPIESTEKPTLGEASPPLVVGVGASAGGIQAVRELFSQVVPDSGLAYVLVMHLDPEHESFLAELIGGYARIPAVEVEDGMPLMPDRLHVIPPNTELTVRNGILFLAEPSEHRGLRMPIDRFLQSLAEDAGDRAVAVILSGTGSDGTLGVRAIKGLGGMVVAQHPDDATFDGMPRSAMATGDVDHVLPAREIPAAVEAYLQHREIAVGGDLNQAGSHDLLENILALLVTRSKRDFRPYKRDTIRRRALRRMSLKRVASLKEYHALLSKSEDEVGALVSDLLIGVTGFFRDPEVWDTLYEKHLLPLVKVHDGDQPIRVWVPGCSTGEEAYTIAILLDKAINALKQRNAFSVFATDINMRALEVGRGGSYPASLLADVDPEYRDKYFDQDGDAYTVKRSLRERITFAEQELLRDPPFSKLAMICCRNLLIYIAPEHQERIVTLFHFSLDKSGLLVLGTSESVGGNSKLFYCESRKARIYRRIDVAPSFSRNLSSLAPHMLPSGMVGARKPTTQGFGQITHQALIEVFAPPAVLLSQSLRVLYSHGPVSDYLRLPPGEPTDDLLAMAGDTLRGKLRSGLFEASQTRKPVLVSGGRVKRGREWFGVEIDIHPRFAEDKGGWLYLVTFRDTQEILPAKAADATPDDGGIREQLEEDLYQTREELRITLEQMEASNEEMKAANEEVMSMNEELQSTNEELETSKEELQSLNEELSTLNSQLEEKLDELEVAHVDLKNFFLSTNIATVFLDRQFCIRRFTPALAPLIGLLNTDIGRPIDELTWHFDDDKLLKDAGLVLANVHVAPNEVKAHDGRWYQRKILPYRTDEGRLDGVVVLFHDITRLKRMDMALRTSEANLRRITDSMPVLIAYVDGEHTYRFNNATYSEWFGFSQDTIRSMRVRDVIGDEAYEVVRPYMQRALAGEKVHFEGWLQFAHGGQRYVSGEYVPDTRDDGEVQGFFVLVSDITERKCMEDELRELNRRNQWQLDELEALFDAAPIGVFIGRDAECAQMSVNRTGSEMLRIEPGTNPSFSAPGASALPFKVFHGDRELGVDELPMQKAARIGQPVLGFEETIEFTDGERKHLLTYAAPLFDQERQVRGCVGTFVDITKLRLLEHQSDDLALLLTALGGEPPLGLIEVDTDGHVSFWNNAAGALLGRNEKAALGRPLADLLPEFLAIRVQRKLGSDADYPVRQQCIQVSGGDGIAVPLRVFGVALAADSGAGAVYLFYRRCEQ